MKFLREFWDAQIGPLKLFKSGYFNIIKIMKEFLEAYKYLYFIVCK